MTEYATTPRRHGRWVLFLVLVLVNSGAVWGQTGWALDHIVPPRWPSWSTLALALAFALALELIGVYLATMADEAESVGLPAGGIRLGSYAVGLVSGALNLSHWWVTGLAAAFAFGFLSTVSPFLWGIWSRVRRGRPIAPSRRFWHPIRSIRLMQFMAWEGIVDEMTGIRAMEFRNIESMVPVSPAGGPMTAREYADRGRQIKLETGQSWEQISSQLGISARYLYQCRTLYPTSKEDSSK